MLEKSADTTIRNSHGFLAKDFLKNCKNSSSLVKLFDVKRIKIDADLVTQPSTSKIRGKPRGKVKSITIYSTGMSEDEKIKLVEASKKLNFKFVRERSSNGLLFQSIPSSIK